MLHLLDEVTRRIRSKTKDEWQALFRAKVEEGRTFLQANGEKAAIGGFLCGIFIIVFYKLFILILTLVTLAYLIIITVSDTD